MKLRSKLTISLILITNIALLIVSLIGYTNARNNLKQNIDYQMNLTVEKMSMQFDEWVLNKSQIIETIAEIIKNTDSTDKITRGHLLAYQRDPDIYDIYVAFVENGYLIDGDNWIPPEGYDPRDRPWFENALKNDKLSFSIIHDDETVKDIFNTTISLPIKDKNNNTIAVLGGDIAIKELNEAVKKMDLQGHGYGFLIDDTGFCLSHPDEKLVKTNLLENKDMKEQVNEMLKQKDGKIEYKLDKNNSLIVYRKIPSTNWIIGLNVNESDVYKNLYDLRTKYILINLLAFIITVIFSLYISGNIIKPINDLKKVANTIGTGDLTTKIELNKKDEVGELANSFAIMTNNLKDLVLNTYDISNNLSASSNQLSHSSDDLNLISEDVSDSINKISIDLTKQFEEMNKTKNTVNEIVQSIQQVALNSQDMNNHGLTVLESAQNGKITIDKTMNTMDNIEEVMQKSSNATKILTQNSNEITSIINIISDIANKTNLLSLNAAIEAARAGESGKGFAVVADEIRKLAEESNRSAEKISSLIKEVQLQTKNAIDLMNKGMYTAKEGSNAVSDAKKAFDEILEGVNEITYKIQDVSASSQQISASSQEIAYTIENVSNISEENVLSSEKVASASQKQLTIIEEMDSSSKNLADMSAELQENILKFKI